MAPSRPVGACKPVFAGASDKARVFPIAPRGAAGAEKALGRRPVVPGRTGAAAVSPLAARLHARFRDFQGQAKHIEESLLATHLPVDSGLVSGVLERYSAGLAQEMRAVRDDIRRGGLDVSKSVHADHDTLCFCLAIWELVHEVAVSSAPSAPRILHWCNRHYLEQDIADWWQGARRWAEDPSAMKKKTEFWDPICRLALSDCKAEVVELLQRSLEKADAMVARVCEFLRRIPSMRQMDEFIHTEAEFRQAVHEIQVAATEILREVPEGHPTRALLEIYAGCPQEAFEAGKDVAAKWTRERTWVEDFAFAHAWVFPDLRRSELADLLRMVAHRRTDESIDHMDYILFEVLRLDIPAVLGLIDSFPDNSVVGDAAAVPGKCLPKDSQRLPAFFTAHLVDVLYFAGRIATTVEMRDREPVPPRDWYLMAYAQELCSGPRAHQMYAVNYLRAGGSQACRRMLELAAEQFCGSAGSDAEFEESLDLLLDLGLGDKYGKTLCRRWGCKKRSAGDLTGCLSWACRAEDFGVSSGAFVSELIDELSEEDPEGLLAVLTPSDLSEPLERYPPESLLQLLVPWRAGDLRPESEKMQGDYSSLLAPSGRLYFYTQYARCRAWRRAGRTASSYAPTLVRILATGVAAPGFVSKLLEEELWPALSEEKPALDKNEVLSLMRFVQTVFSDPFGRVQLTLGGQPVDRCELHRRLGSCLSRAILRGRAARQEPVVPPMALLA